MRIESVPPGPTLLRREWHLRRGWNRSRLIALAACVLFWAIIALALTLLLD